jgi:TrmH family RNA methyltransferase
VLPVRFVLVRPRVAENVGAAARVLRNFGHADWVLVDPERLDLDVARRLAVGAEDLIDQVRAVPSLDDAVGDCAWVIGTESRKVRGRAPLEPEGLAGAVADVATRGRTAIVFGGERDGLRAAELARCDEPSLNLAQAVAIYAFALREAPLAAPRPVAAVRTAAADAELVAVEESLRSALTVRGFLRGPERHAVLDLGRTLRRARLTRKEARLWVAALRSVARKEKA